MIDLRKNLGQLFIIGFPGEQPDKAFLNFCEEEQIGGVILFADNCRTLTIARQNIARIKASSPDSPSLIAIDQEGGRVCRLKGAPVEFKAASEWGTEPSVEAFQEVYARAIVLMESLGVNLNLAPVADIFLNDKNECLKGRCFSSDPDRVATFVVAALTTAREQGLLSCLKHFPGLGAAEIDPHLGLATADYDRVIWEQRERIPFEAGVQAGADLIMTTHLLADKLDDQIVTGSKTIISELIRADLNFDGPIITDDLGMKGAECLGDSGERAVAAFNAGHDLLLFGQDFEATLAAFEHFAGAVQAGEIDPVRLRLSLERVAGLKFKLANSVVR